MVSIVHNPNLDINTDLSSAGITLQEVRESVSPTNQNFFKVKWDSDVFPSIDDGCGTCTTLDDGCLCDVVVNDERVFDQKPTYDQVLSQLKIGSISIDWMSEYSSTPSSNDVVQMFNKDGTDTLYIDTIFGVDVGGETKYFMNSKSTVTLNDGTHTYSFRNPPSHMSIIDPKSIDAYYETEALMDMYLNHDNTPPFIASRMIKRLVTSNPR